MSQVKDLVGQVFGRLTVTAYAGQNRHKQSTWHCLCSCGGTITANRVHLRSGRTASCGCLRVENGRRSVKLLAAINSKGDDITYARAHQRVSEQRGSAALYPCADCGDQAEDWSLKHNASKRLVTNRGSREDGLAFSTETEDYEPRCRPCHKTYDMAVAQ